MDEIDWPAARKRFGHAVRVAVIGPLLIVWMLGYLLFKEPMTFLMLIAIPLIFLFLGMVLGQAL